MNQYFCLSVSNIQATIVINLLMDLIPSIEFGIFVYFFKSQRNRAMAPVLLERVFAQNCQFNVILGLKMLIGSRKRYLKPINILISTKHNWIEAVPMFTDPERRQSWTG